MLDFIRDRFGTAAAAASIATLAVGVWVAVDQITGEGISGAGVVWWIPYGVFVLTFGYDVLTSRRPQWRGGKPLVAIEAVAASMTYVASPNFAWTAVLMVVSAVSGAYVLSTPALVGLVGGQTVVAGVGQLLVGTSAAEAVLAMAAFGTFQMFAVIVVLGERRQSEARSAIAAAHIDLRATSAMLAQSTQLSERLRIARELHDLVGHQLTALSIELEVASHHSDGEGRQHLERARNTANELLGDVRAVVGDLRAHRSGLSEPLHVIVDGLVGMEPDLKVVEETAVDEETAMAIIRCVHEVVTNVLRHSDAESLTIHVHSGPDGVTLNAEDDGRGVEPVVEGHGLTGMRERVEGLGGKLGVSGRPGQGLRVDAWIPPR